MSTNYIGVSLGSSNTYIYKRTKGIVLGEASVIAYDTYDESKIIAFGTKAKRMKGRTPETITVMSPIKKGVIADFQKAVVMLKYYVERVKRNRWGLEIAATVPACATSVERRAVKDAAKAAYGNKVYIVEEPIAAALGCGLEIFDAKGQIIVDIGGGNTEISVISLGGIVFTKELEQSSEQFDKDIMNYIRKNYKMLIGEGTAEEIKINLGSVLPDFTIDFMTVNGRDLITGLPVSNVISTDDVREALSESVVAIIDGIISTLEHIDPSLSADIIKNKIHLVGGGALLRGWSDIIVQNTGIEAVVADEPMECVAAGAAAAIPLIKKIRQRYKD